MSKPFVNLHTHSFYSILEASSRPKAILEKAESLGHPAVALTDTGVGYGLIDFYENAEKQPNVEPLLGAEIFVAKDSRFERRSGIDGKEGSLVLLAQNETGYTNLLKILSKASLEGFYYKPRVDWDILKEYHEGIIVLTGSTGGLIGKALFEEGAAKALEVWEHVRSVFGEKQVFAECVSRSHEEQKNLNLFWKEHCESNNWPFVITSDARYINPEDEEAADTLLCISRNQLVSDPSRRRWSEKNWFKSFDEISQELAYLGEAFLEQGRQQTIDIAETVDLKLEFGKSLLPQVEVDQDETEASQLRKNCRRGIDKRYPDRDAELSQTIDERLDYELSVIGKMGFDAYFLIVEDFIRFAKENGIAVGPGRGSAAGSIVAYLLDITTVDPIKYELLFERFLNPERISMPDIDIDFSDERREEVLRYVVEKYGAEKVSRVCTFGTLSAKAALKDVGRAHGVAFGEMNALTKLLPNRPGFKLEEALKVADFKKLLEGNSALKKVFKVAQRLEGCVRHVSVHACAVIIGKDELSFNSPLQWAPGAEEIKITQFPYQQLEHLGLLKMDFLGLRNLSIIEKAQANIKQTTGKHLDLENIQMDDKPTFEMMAEGQTTGVFQFESAGMRRYLRELKPTEFEDLVAMNALYRPGPMEYIPEYIKGKHNPKKVKYMHKVLEPILSKTYGIAVYQEQVLKIAQVFAGFSLGEADILRKAIGKKITAILDQQRERFISGAVKKSYDEKLAIKIFDEIVVPFSGYGFNRSHAVCYARIAYETAYLRANYPEEFMAAMMTIDRNNTDRIVFAMNECHDMEIEVLPPSINQSGAYFTIIHESQDPDQESLNTEATSQKQIRFGLTAIKGMGEETVDQIIAERKAEGAFESLQDFAQRVPSKLVNKKTLEALSFSGAFDAFGDRKAIVDSLDELAKFAKEHQEKAGAGQMGLFGGADTEAIGFTLKDAVATKKDILAWERESMGLFVSDHPLKGLQAYFEKYGALIGKLSEVEDKGEKRTIHGLVTTVRKIITRNGKNMAILVVEDTSGKIEVAIFPQTYEKISQKALNVDAFVRIRGKVDERDGGLNLIADEIKVGDLAEVEKGFKSDLQKEESKEESSVPALPSSPPENIWTFEIPEGTTKSQIDIIKQILKENETSDLTGHKVDVLLQGKTVRLPFRVKKHDAMEKELGEVLG